MTNIRRWYESCWRNAYTVPSMFYDVNYNDNYNCNHKDDSNNITESDRSTGIACISRHVIHDNVMHITDWFPTILVAIGLDLDLIVNETGIIDIDGVSHWTQLLDSIHYKYNLKSNPKKIYKLNAPRNIMYYGRDNARFQSAMRWNNIN